ncbi:MAG: radical SAM protein [Candidatus Solibacter usitatus]|nr:radical SAM protein [Candidatus Solibacter usitatus]
MRAVLISTYELGRQPFGLASPAAWLRQRGHQVTCADLSRQPLPSGAVRDADLVAFYLPMHTATRLAMPVIDKARELNPRAVLAGYGLYAPMNEEHLRAHGIQFILGGEFEQALANLADGRPSPDSLDRLRFVTPDRAGLPPLPSYAALRDGGETKAVGYTEASRGCKHLCRHCPIVPVYNGVFRVVQREVVLADIRQQVAAGARHITFGDPDFFNGPAHAMALVEALDREHPALTYDVTIKVEHLLQHRSLLPVLRGTGCRLVTSAVESLDDRVLDLLDKGHTRQDFFEAVRLTREEGLTLSPTFIPFTPWTTWEGYRDLLRTLARLELVEQVSPIQLAIRLLIPAGSRLLELKEVREQIGPFDPEALSYRWAHADPALDRLAIALLSRIRRAEREGASRSQIFGAIWKLAHQDGAPPPDFHLAARASVPYLTEPWYC